MNLTRADVIKLKAEAEALQTAADEAAAAAAQSKTEADANTDDAIKAGAAAAAKIVAVAASAKASAAWRSWNEAEHSVPEVGPGDWRVIGLGVYLIMILLGGVYVLSVLAKALPPDKATGTMRTKCSSEGNDCATPSPTSTPEAIANNAVNANSTSGNTATTNSNQTNSNSNTNANAANQTGTQTPAKTQTPVSTPANANKPVDPKNNDTQEILIPAIICLESVGRTTADGYLFLLVLFSGLVGATTRLVFSFVRHQGIGDFSMRWVWFYLFTPFSGAAISLFLYYVIRGGFYGSAVGKSLALNVFAFFALGTLSGLFAENGMQKLREVAEVILAKIPEKTKSPEKPGE